MFGGELFHVVVPSCSSSWRTNAAAAPDTSFRLFVKLCTVCCDSYFLSMCSDAEFWRGARAKFLALRRCEYPRAVFNNHLDSAQLSKTVCVLQKVGIGMAYMHLKFPWFCDSTMRMAEAHDRYV